MSEHPTFSRPTPWAVHDDGDAVISVIDAEKTFLFGWTRSVESMFLARDIVAAVNEHAALHGCVDELLGRLERLFELTGDRLSPEAALKVAETIDYAREFCAARAKEGGE